MQLRKNQSGFSFIELLLSLGVITVLGFTALQSKIERTEKEVAEAFGTSVALYSQAVASYIADEGVGVPSGTFTGFDWLKSSGCGGSAPEDYVPCSWNPRLPFNIVLETEVIYGTGVVTDPCPAPIGHVCAETRLSVPATNGQERLDLAAEMLHATQGSSNSIRSTQQRFSLNDVGQLQVTAVGTQAPPTQFLRVDGINNMDATFDMGGKNLVDVGDLTAEGEVEMGRFVDRDDPAFIMDPNAQSILQDLDVRGDFAAAAGGNLNATSVFDVGADIESAATFADEANFRDLAKFIGGETDFNTTVESSGGTSAKFTVADSQDLANFHAELEIVGTGVVGGACDATKENMRFNSAGELLECVSAAWQYAGIETRKGTITYYSLDSTNSYGEFFWAGDGIDLPGKHHTCSAQSIESSNLAEGGGARIESTSGADQFGRRSFQYLAAAGVRDAADIPLQLESGERTVICLALGPEPVQATVSTQANSAPTGSVSCTTGYVGIPFASTASVSDPDTPITYRWSATGACSLLGVTRNRASIARNTAGWCTVNVTVTDFYNASRTISNTCRVRPRNPPILHGECSCTTNQCASGVLDLDPPEPPQPPTWDPVVDGPWDPTEQWTCEGRRGGRTVGCTEGNSCPPIDGICASEHNDCVEGNASGLVVTTMGNTTTFRWTCLGIRGGSNDNCVDVITPPVGPCPPSVPRIPGQCGTALNTCITTFGMRPATPISWICEGQCAPDDLCTVDGPVDGACGDTTILDDCAAGSPQSVSGTSWICQGINGGNDEPCTLTQPIVNGRCGTGSGTNIGDCSAGTSSGTTNPWTCDGINGGVDVTCEFGVCNDTTTPPCDVGDFENITGTLEWRCEGNINNTLVDNATCVIAVCGRTQGTCDEGTASGNTNPWTCAGGADHGTADDVDCDVGACGTADNVVQGCTVGDWSHVDDTATDVLWDCKGSYHDPAITTDDIRCTLGLPICGPTRGTCAEGTPVGTGDDWICRGATTDINCHVGICDSGFVGACVEGAPTSIINPLTLDTNPWTCQGSYHDPAITTDDDDCFFGVCGTADNSATGCTVGTWVSVSDLIGPPPTIRWTCAGSFPGETNDDDPCTQRNGACDSMPPLLPGECDAGVANDPSGATNPWICEGTGGGTDETCTIGVCGDEDDMTNGCRVGVWQAAPDHEWTCTGNVKNDGCYHGVCDYAGPGQCVAPSTSSGLNYEWTCRGADSMSTADDVDCIKAQCNPTGSDNDIEACITGIRSDLTDLADGTARWMCEGNDTNRTDDDAGPCMPGPTDGVCDFIRQPNGDPEIRECKKGQASGLNNPWTCEGVNGGADTSCLMGHCGKAQDVCIAGTFQDASFDRWDCLGGDNATEDDDDLVCDDTEIPGECKWQGPDDVGNCEEGTSTGQISPWICQGNNDQSTGDDVDCIQGVCGTEDNDTNGCLAGVYDDIIGDTWRCRGNHPTTLITTDDSDVCTSQTGCGISCPTTDYNEFSGPMGILFWDTDANSGWCRVSSGNNYPYGSNFGIWPPEQLSCDAAQCGATQNTCDSGQYLSYNENLGQWACLTAGPNNAGNIIVCMPLVDGACGTADNAVQGCTAGTWQDETGDGWTCLGTGGGADASCGTSCHACSSQVDWYHDEIWRDIADVHPNFRVLTLNSESGTYDHPEYFWDYQYPSNYTCEQAENHWFDAWDYSDNTFQINASQCEPLSCQDVFGDNRLVGAFPDCSCPSGGYIWTLDGTSITGGVCTLITDGYCLSSNWSVGYGEFCQTGTYVNTPEPGWICQGEPGGTDAICN